MLRLARVAGPSMSPTLEDGDFVLALRPLWKGLASGDVVLVQHPELGLIIKRIVRRSADGSLELAGDAPLSTCSAALGRVPESAVLGRAWLRISPRPGHTRRLGRHR